MGNIFSCIRVTKDTHGTHGKPKRKCRKHRKWNLHCFSKEDLAVSHIPEGVEFGGSGEEKGGEEEEWRLCEVDEGDTHSADEEKEWRLCEVDEGDTHSADEEKEWRLCEVDEGDAHSADEEKEWRLCEVDEGDLHSADEEKEWRLCEVDEGDTHFVDEEEIQILPEPEISAPASTVEEDEDKCADDEQPVPVETLAKIHRVRRIPTSPTPERKENICSSDPNQIFIELEATAGDIEASTDEVPQLAYAGDAPGVKDVNDSPMCDTSVVRHTDSPLFTCVDDNDLYQSEDVEPVPEPVTKIYHYKAEDWGDFHTALAKEYKEQYGDNLAISSSTSDIPSDAPAKRVSRPPIPDYEKEQTRDYIRKILKIILYRVDEAVVLKEFTMEDDDFNSVSSEEFENDRWTPPLVEGEIYSGPGILKKTVHGDSNDNQKRNITWGPDVKPPAREYNIQDAISDAFLREWSKIRTKRTRKERQKAKLIQLLCRQVNNHSSEMITQGCRIPITVGGMSNPTSGTRSYDTSRSRTIIPPGCRIPIPIRRHTALESSEAIHRFEVVTKASRIPEPVRTAEIPIYMRRGDTANIERSLHPHTKTRPAATKAKVPCWRPT